MKQEGPKSFLHRRFTNASSMLKSTICVGAMVLSSFNTSAAVLEEDVDINLKNKPLIEFFQAIEQQTEYVFVYKTSTINSNRKISLDVKGEELKDVLDEMLDQNNLTYTLENNKIIISENNSSINTQATQASNKLVIKGSVVDDQGTPLPGATLVIKGTTQGTITDFDGNFSLTNVPKGATIVFSYVGMSSKEVIADKTNFKIQLESDAVNLQEVVAIGYGVQKKVNLTGSVASIKSEEILKTKTANITNSMVGKVPGLLSVQRSGQPGEDAAQISIRGNSSLGNNGALVVVDGVVRDGFNQIDPNMIETVTVLKDAAATSVYGVRASNGVILVTTKKGKEGKTSVSYSGSYGVQTPTKVPELMDAYTYASNINQAFINEGDAPRYTDEDLQKFKEGTEPGYQSTNWWDETFDKLAPISQHNLSVTGGSKKSNYYISLGMLDQKGMYETSWFKRYNLRSNLETKISDDLKLNLNLAGRIEETSNSGSGTYAIFYGALRAWPTMPTTHPDGKVAWSGTPTNSVYDATETGYDKRTKNTFQSSLSLDYNISKIKGLHAKALVAYDATLTPKKKFVQPYNYYIKNTDGTFDEKAVGNKTTLKETFNQNKRLTTQLSLNYNRTFGSHELSGLLLWETFQSDSNNFNAYRENGFLSSTLDQMFAGGDLNKNNGGSAKEAGRLGYVGRLTYNYKSKYLFETNFRYDGSFNFPNGNKWGFFPSVSAGWRVSEESFIKDNFSGIDNLKLRSSMGKSGNDNIPQYNFIGGYSVYSGSVIGDTFYKGLRESLTPNPFITWETSTNFDVGIDLSLWQGKLTLEANYFYKNTTDILVKRDAEVPLTYGGKLPVENLGETENSGYEFVLGHNGKIGDLTYNINGNFTFARNKVIEKAEPSDVPDRIKRTGRPMNQFYGLQALGLFQTEEEIQDWADQNGNKNKGIKPGDIKYQDFNNDGKINGEDIHCIGKSFFPEINYGVNLSLAYKGFDMSVFFQGASNFVTYLEQQAAYSFMLEGNSPMALTDSWSPENRDARYPRLLIGQNANNTQQSSYWLEDASYLRLKSLNIGYTFNFKQKKLFKSFRVYASGTNLFTWDKLTIFDPETPKGRGATYPPMKVYSLGLDFSL
ncbi:TonB-dependent receptor [Halosquirtibacter xylanolyticus]|uniref:TonB-dependent receptor n=1 Tax=Halosquirtibacter xylanolyticus TaxID=3374599 RepID=UPI0037491F36|nr:TonB-dependent receptor [Prolixibacteraceae bacterium]